MPGQALAPVDVARDVYRVVRQYERIIQNPALQGLAAGADANVILPRGETYRQLWFKCTIAGVAATKAELISNITRIQLIIDGDTKVDLSADEMIFLQEYYQNRAGADPIGDTGYLVFSFCRPWHREITGEDDTAWGTRDVENFSMIVTLAGGATIDAITTYRVVTNGEPMGRHYCVRRKPRNNAASGLERISEWKREIGLQMLALHVKKNTVTDVKLTVDNVTEVDTKYALIAQRAKQYERTPQSAWTSLDFAVRNRLMDAVPMIAQNFDLDLTWSAAPNTYTLLQETVEGPAT